jgi:transposase-like protein
MARARREGEPSSYQGRPPTPVELMRRVELVNRVLGGRMTISEAARELGIARVNMQTLVHRAEAAVVTALSPRPTGPAARPARERELEQELGRLRRRTTKLEEQLQAMDQMLAAAGEIIRALRGLPPTSSKRSSARSPRAPKTGPSSEDPEPPPAMAARTMLAAAATRMVTMTDRGARIARALGVRAATLRRWLARLAEGRPLDRRRQRRRAAVPPELEASVRTHVRVLGSLVGAASLARSIGGISRRGAAAIKRDELTVLECERQARCGHVRVAVPGVVRGFDAMHLDRRYALVASDACVPFRTTVVAVGDYDARSVAMTLAADFKRHGPPLVLRFDRARCHDAPPVASVLRAHRVIPLHGPPHHPQYYGQLERQNREHRTWLAGRAVIEDELLTAMQNALNTKWRRPTLGWQTAAEAWLARPQLDEDRDALLADVNERARRLADHNLEPSLAMRLAIEQALIERGFLQLTPGHGRYVNRQAQ